MRASAILPLLLVSANTQAAEEILFNGKDLMGWEASFGFGGAAQQRKAEELWSVEEGAITCAGGPRTNGWLHTTRSFTNYELHLEFRWLPIDPAVLAAGGNIYNAGVFLRSNPKPSPDGGNMMMTYQAQIIHTPARSSGEAGGGTGDMWISGYDHPRFKGERPGPPVRLGPRPAAPGQAARPPRTFRAPPPGVAVSRMFARAKFAEKPIGQWNSYDITVNGDKLTYRLNGEVINEGTGAAVIPGRIGLECENTPIAFRNIRVKTID